MVHLAGVTIKRTYPGPPNFTSIKDGDRAETSWYLKLDRPICIESDKPSDVNEPESNVKSLQLVIKDPKVNRPLSGQRVRIQGTLFHSHTGHHHTRVLIDVITQELAGRQR